MWLSMVSIVEIMMAAGYNVQPTHINSLIGCVESTCKSEDHGYLNLHTVNLPPNRFHIHIFTEKKHSLSLQKTDYIFFPYSHIVCTVSVDQVRNK